MARKGILMAGGEGTRLRPLTTVVNKHLLPVYDKPMIYNPISTLMLAGVDEILLISTTEGVSLLRRLLGDGSQWGIALDYAEQPRPLGIGDGLRIGRDFIGDEQILLALGDNVFHGEQILSRIREASETADKATAFAYFVREASSFGVVEFDAHGAARAIVEKPERAGPKWAVTGLYALPADAVDIAMEKDRSARGEYEITDILREYMRRDRLLVQRLSRGAVWLDAGTFESLQEAANFIEIMERRTGLKINCPEEVAYRVGNIDLEQLRLLIARHPDNEYRRYLQALCDQERDLRALT